MRYPLRGLRLHEHYEDTAIDHYRPDADEAVDRTILSSPADAPPPLGRAPWLTHLVVRRAGVEAHEQGPRLRRHHRYVVVWPGERPDIIQRIKPHQCDELDEILLILPQELDPTKTGDPACGDPWEDGAAEL